jgi:hypothetical protein
MKYTIAVLFVIVLASCQVRAQLDLEQYAKYSKGERLKRTGIGLTVAGGLLTVIGINMLSSAHVQTTTGPNGQTQYSSNDPNAQSGALCLLGGMGMLGAGIPIWIAGAHKVHKYKMDGLSLNLNVAPYGRPGVRLALRF